jgi:hypothetical protein
MRVYFGTTGGQVYASADAGDSWAPIVRDLAAVVGCIGGIYGIGGGSILAPVLIATGRPPAEVAPAAISSTFVTSAVGVITFTVAQDREAQDREAQES